MPKKEFIVDSGIKIYDQETLIMEITQQNTTIYNEFITVSGGSTVDLENLKISDNLITINKDQTGTPLSGLQSGFEVERGDSPNYFFYFVESDDSFKIGLDGDLQSVSTREDNPSNNSLAIWNNTTRRYESNTNLIWDGELKVGGNKVATETWVDTNYGHPAKTWVDKSNLDTSTVISNLTIDSLGHPIDWTTRELTADDVGAAPSSHTHSYLPLSGGTLTGVLTISGDNPSEIKFEDTASGAADFYIHVNSQNFYVLVDRDSSGNWESPHPLMLESDTNKGFLFDDQIATQTWVTNNLNKYTHPGKAWVNKATLSGATVISNLTIDSLGHPTDWTTRELTADDVGAISSAGGTIDGDLNINGDAAVSGSIKGDTIGVDNTDNTTGKGLSLYNGPTSGQPTYGMMFAGTETFGTHGSVTETWATYFTTSTTTNRGWIFKGGSGTTGNVASIRNDGSMTLDGTLTVRSGVYIPSYIYHSGDTNTYMQFHNADQWRVVTGGGQRLEVNNSNIQANREIIAYDGIRVDGSTQHGYAGIRGNGTNGHLMIDSTGSGNIYLAWDNSAADIMLDGKVKPRTNVSTGTQSINRGTSYTPSRGWYNAAFFTNRGGTAFGLGDGGQGSSGSQGGPYNGSTETRVYTNYAGDSRWYYARF